MDHLGGCHCGNIHVRLRLSKPPEDNPLRACTCSFCRSHSPRMVADLGGLFEVWADDWSLVENYRFGTRTCDFLICRAVSSSRQSRKRRPDRAQSSSM